MKNMSKRNKIILAIVGVLVIAVVAVAVFAQAGGGELFGASALVVTPSSPTIVEGNSIVLSVNSVYNCNWFTDNYYIASFSGGATEVKEAKSVTVYGNLTGSTTISAKCGLINVNKVATVVTVNPLAFSPSYANGFVGNTISISAPTGALAPCLWTTMDYTHVQFWVNNQPTTAQQTGGSVTLYFNSVGPATIMLSCWSGRQNANLATKACAVGNTACLTQ